MGVEYWHGIFVPDLSWKPTWRHIESITGALVKWKFSLASDSYFNLVKGRGEPISQTTARDMPDNLGVVLVGPEGKPAARLIGPSMSGDSDSDRYISGAQLVVGSDFKVMANIEGDEVDVIMPPTTGGKKIKPLEFHHLVPHEAIVYPATWESKPPRTDVGRGFDRVWRAGVLLDCHKDVPAIAETKAGAAKSFIRDLEAAFGAKLVELGWYH